MFSRSAYRIISAALCFSAFIKIDLAYADLVTLNFSQIVLNRWDYAATYQRYGAYVWFSGVPFYLQFNPEITLEFPPGTYLTCKDVYGNYDPNDVKCSIYGNSAYGGVNVEFSSRKGVRHVYVDFTDTEVPPGADPEINYTTTPPSNVQPKITRTAQHSFHAVLESPYDITSFSVCSATSSKCMTSELDFDGYYAGFDLSVNALNLTQNGVPLHPNSNNFYVVAPNTNVQINVPISGSAFNNPEMRTASVTLQVGEQPPQVKIVSLADIQSSGTLNVPFMVNLGTQDVGLQAITARVATGNPFNESDFQNNSSSAYLQVQGGYKLVSQITNGGNDGPSGEKPVIGSAPIKAQYPLGSEFTVQLQQPGPDGVTYVAVPAIYQLGDAIIAPPVNLDSLFKNLAVIEYGGANISPTSGPVTFQTIHLGQAPLRIIPSDGSPAVTVNLNVIEPDALGEIHNEVDDLLIYAANQYGIPPDYLKGQVKHEGDFNPISYRYEPIGAISDLRSFSSQKVNAPDINIADSRGSDPYEHFLFETIDERFPEGDQLSTADILPRLKLSMTTNPLWSPSSTSTPTTRNIDLSDRFVSVRQIYYANDSKQHWSKHAPTLLVIDINDHPEILDFTAQTAVAASYGLMQVMYSTAIDGMGWQGRHSDNAKNPSFLFDTPDNLDDGGGSVTIGAGYDASLFFQENPQIDRKHPYFGSPSEFDTAYMRMFTCYNQCSAKIVSASKYGSEVIQNAADFFEPLTNEPIFP